MLRLKVIHVSKWVPGWDMAVKHVRSTIIARPNPKEMLGAHISDFVMIVTRVSKKSLLEQQKWSSSVVHTKT